MVMGVESSKGVGDNTMLKDAVDICGAVVLVPVSLALFLLRS